MDTKFFQTIAECNTNKENISLNVVSGEYCGEKAVLSGGKFVYLSNESGFLAKHAPELANIHETGTFNIINSLVYAERVGTEKKIVICGAGHVSMPIIKLAKNIGFSVTVIDDREIFAQNAVNTGADFVICGKFESALSKIPGGLNYYFIIVTRGHSYDSECLRTILKKNYAYVGMMGSGRRVKIVKSSLIAEGYNYDTVTKIHAPIGLPINAETPEEIAISIMAEIIQIKNQSREAEFPKDILNDILGTGHSMPLAGKKVLCTIISKQGAGPRNAGTKMIYTSEKKIIGTIGGGLMEAQVMKKADEIFSGEVSAPVLLKFNLTAGELSTEGEVCGGVIEVLIESLQ